MYAVSSAVGMISYFIRLQVSDMSPILMYPVKRETGERPVRTRHCNCGAFYLKHSIAEHGQACLIGAVRIYAALAAM